MARIAAAMHGVSCWHGHADHAGDAGGTGGTATSSSAAIHWQLWCTPASGSGWPRSSACSQSACKQTCSVPGWGSSRGKKESLAKIIYNILQYLRHAQQCQSGPLAQHSIASGGLVLFATAQMVKGRPRLSVNLENVLEGHGGTVQAMMPGGAIAGTEHGHAMMRHGRVRQMSSRRKRDSQHHQTPLILIYHSLASHPQQFHQRAPRSHAQQPFCARLNAATLGWSVLMPSSLTAMETGTTKTQRKLQLKMKS